MFFTKEYFELMDDLVVEELAPLQPKGSSYFERHKLIRDRESLIHEDGMLEQGTRMMSDAPGRAVVYLPENGWVIERGAIKGSRQGRVSEVIHTFEEPFRHIVDGFYLSDSKILFAADDGKKPYVVNKLWLLDAETFQKQVIDEDPYYLFDRSPLISRPAMLEAILLVYYTDSYSFGFGGDASAPRFSTLRLFNPSFPEGKDILRFSLKAGTVEKVEWSENGLIVTTDPSLPSGAGKPRVNARQWKVLLPW